ncbi:MAG: hypothetical protein L3J83_11220 [Proteobacteria bacterium]|nr:hypothetical protein [Pseudomonadota bacterium]
MFAHKIKIISALIMLAVVSISTLLPIKFTLIAMLSSLVITLSYPIIQSYDINYKYWFSFVGQLLGLIFFVFSFVLVFVVGANLITQ